MRRLIVGAMVSLDGVMQAPGGPHEDPTGGFELGGWVAPFFEADPVAGEELGKQFKEPFDLLLGRRTYDIFAAYWPYRAEGASYDDVAKAFNGTTKYVVTRKGLELTWKRSVALRDGAKDVAKLKQGEGPTLLTQGSTELVHSLLAAGLVDELRTFTFPVVLGKGKRLFGDDGQPRAFELTHGVVSPKGVIAATYVRAGEVQTSTVGGEAEPSPAERARREKLASEA